MDVEILDHLSSIRVEDARWDVFHDSPEFQKNDRPSYWKIVILPLPPTTSRNQWKMTHNILILADILFSHGFFWGRTRDIRMPEGSSWESMMPPAKPRKRSCCWTVTWKSDLAEVSTGFQRWVETFKKKTCFFPKIFEKEGTERILKFIKISFLAIPLTLHDKSQRQGCPKICKLLFVQLWAVTLIDTWKMTKNIPWNLKMGNFGKKN